MGTTNPLSRQITNQLYYTPLYFVRSGYMDINDDPLKHTGTNSYSWSSTSASTIWGAKGLGAYRFYFNMTNLSPSRGPDNRWDSFPLR